MLPHMVPQFINLLLSKNGPQQIETLSIDYSTIGGVKHGTNHSDPFLGAEGGSVVHSNAKTLAWVFLLAAFTS
jgi:hypothetical protein